MSHISMCKYKHIYMLIIKDQNEHNIAEMCINICSLDWYAANLLCKNDCILKKSAEDENKQLARLKGWMVLRCVCRRHLKYLMVRRFLIEGGREFQIDDPENARLISYRSMRGRGGIRLFEPDLLVELVKSERSY